MERFGAAQADLAAWALTTGDPLADAVVEEVRVGGRTVREALQRGITHGLSALEDPPPAVAALLTDTETLPDFVDAALTPGISVIRARQARLRKDPREFEARRARAVDKVRADLAARTRRPSHAEGTDPDRPVPRELTRER